MNAGMVCMKSNAGRMSELNRSLRAARTPSGVPMATEIRTATSTRASVSIVSSKRPMEPMREKAAAVNRANRQPRASRATSVSTATITQSGGAVSAVSIQSASDPTTVRMNRKRKPRLSPKKATSSAIHPPMSSDGNDACPTRRSRIDPHLLRGQGGQQPGPGHHPFEHAAVVDDGDRHGVEGGVPGQLGQRRVPGDTGVVVDEEVAYVAVAAGYALRQAVVAGDAEDPPVLVEDVGSVELLVGEPVEHLLGGVGGGE